MPDKTLYEIASRDDTTATVRITVAAVELAAEIEAVYSQYANELSIPGFRKGRVPKGVLEARFGKESFVAEAKESLERHHLPAALEQLGLHPMSTPKLEEKISLAPDVGFTFEVTFAVLPAVNLPAYRGLEVAVASVPPVTDEDVERALAEVQGQFGVLVPREGDTVSEGDIVRVREKTEEWDTRAEADNPVTSALVGRKVGESVDIDVPHESGKRLQTQLDVMGLRQVQLPAIDDELAKDAGFESLDALRADVRRRLGEARDEHHRRAVETALVETLVEKTTLPLPEPFVLELVDEEVDRIRKALERPGSPMTFDKYLAERATSEADLRKEIRASVERRLRRELVLGRLAEVENVSFDDAQLEAAAQAEASEAGEDGMRFVAQLKADDRWDDYRSAKVTERVLGILREAAVVTEKEA